MYPLSLEARTRLVTLYTTRRINIVSYIQVFLDHLPSGEGVDGDSKHATPETDFSVTDTQKITWQHPLAAAQLAANARDARNARTSSPQLRMCSSKVNPQVRQVNRVTMCVYRRYCAMIPCEYT